MQRGDLWRADNEAQGFDKKICPVTGNLFALALWMLNSQFIARMIDRDMVPGLDMGVHLMGGRK